MLKQFIDALNWRDYQLFRNAVIDQCKITRATWFNWRENKSEPLNIYKGKINEIAQQMFNQKIYNL